MHKALGLAAVVAVVVAMFIAADPSRIPMALKVFSSRATRAVTSRKSHQGPPQKLHVVGAGFGRTGTESLRIALDKLGWKTYHMVKNFEYGHMPAWAEMARAVAEQPEPPSFTSPAPAAAADAVLDVIEADGFNATVDFPACLLFERMMKRNPNARVLLTKRQSPQVWSKSFLDTIGQFFRPGYLASPPISFAMPMFTGLNEWIRNVTALHVAPPGPRYAEYSPDAPAMAQAAYTKWLAHVRASVPAHQLLEFQPGDGWAPLCSFLSVPDDQCPDEPYPRSNGSVYLKRMIAALLFLTEWWPLIAPALVLAFVFGLRAVMRCVWRRACGEGGGRGRGKHKQQ